MKLGIIATVIDSLHLTGVERYALEMIRRVPEHLRKSVCVFCNKAGQDVIRPVAEGMTLHVSPSSNRIFCDQIWLPYAVRRTKLDFVYNATLSYPWIGYGGIPFGLMLHDATPWRFPETISKGMRLYYLPQLNRAVHSKSLDLIITNSRSSAADISQYCGIPESRIVPIHLGVDYAHLRNAALEAAQKNTPRVQEPYILTVGTIEPRKNLNTLMLAFSELINTYPELMLVVVGRQGWQEQLAIPADVVNKVVFTGYVSDSELAALYTHAELFVFPSIYEGFGLPLLEAMACGTPVLASRSSSLPEIGGETCMYAEPTSPSDFAVKMSKILSDNMLREKMSAEGISRAGAFSWDKTVTDTWAIISETASNESLKEQSKR